MKQEWRKEGRIFDPADHSFGWLASHAAVPTADLIRGDRYRVWYSGRDRESRSHMSYLEIDINEPTNLLYVHPEPVLSPGAAGRFDDSGVMASSIVDDGGRKYLYYAGWNRTVTVPFRNAMGVAVSDDHGKTYRKCFDGPILDRTTVDPIFVGAGYALQDKDCWRMWYLSCLRWDLSGKSPRHYYHLRYASSEDGIHWNRDGAVSIDFKNESEYAISRPSVIFEDGVYRMWYSYRGESYRIGYAESSDGIHFDRMDDQVGLDVSRDGWDSEMIEYAHVIDHGGKKHMFYNGNRFGESGIGYAALDEQPQQP